MANDLAKQRAMDRAAGLLLIVAAGLALVAANSPAYPLYHGLLETTIGPAMPRLGEMSVHYWIADGLMAVRPGALNFLHVQAFVDEVITVSDDQIVDAARLLWDSARIAIEPSGATSVAGVLSRLADWAREGPVVAAVHADWRGVIRGAAPAALEHMRALGARDIVAAIGPCISAAHFEVGPEVVQEFRRVFGPRVANVGSGAFL
jgi:hypothetical protein